VRTNERSEVTVIGLVVVEVEVIDVVLWELDKVLLMGKLMVRLVVGVLAFVDVPLEVFVVSVKVGE
jgi:hypothetical protein